MRRLALVALLSLLVSGLAAAAELDDLGKQVLSHPATPAALQAAQTILQKYPLNDQTTHDKTVAVYGATEVYAACAVVVGRDLLTKQGQPAEALALCDLYFKFFPLTTQKAVWVPQALELAGKAALAAAVPPDQALLRAQVVSKYVLDRGPLGPAPGLLADALTLYQSGGQKDEGRKFLEGLPCVRPDVVEAVGFWKALVGMYIAAGQTDQAKQAAIWGYRLVPLAPDPGKDEALQQLLRILVITDGKAGIEAFLEYLKTGSGPNPLASVPPLPLTDAQRQQQEAAVAGNWGLAVDAYLLQGQFSEALHAAQVQVLSEGADAQAGVMNIARCFKAKDMCCVRANLYLAWVKTGAGVNPVASF